MDGYRRGILQLIEKRNPPTTLKEASKAIGMNHAYLHQFLYKRVPKYLGETVRPKLARFLNVEEKDLLAPDQVVSFSAPDVAHGEFARVPFYDVKASAGHGSIAERPQILHHIAFRREWLRRLTNAGVENLAVISVVGDSMEPNLSDNDTVLVDLTCSTPGADGIYVLLYDEGLRVKRLRIDPIRKVVRIISDNPAYDPIDNLRTDEIRLFGRVIWLGRKL